MRSLRSSLRIAPVLALVSLGLGLSPAPLAAAPGERPVDARLSLLARGGLRHPELALRSSTIPLVIELERSPTKDDLAAIEATGAQLVLGGSGAPLGRGRTLVAEAPVGAESLLAALPAVKRVRFDGPLVRAPRPLDLTAQLISADATWRSRVGEGPLLTGAGVTICDVDNGMDVSHPMFFRADGGLFDWIDVDDNGVFEPAVDAVDLGAGPVTLRHLNGVVWDRYTGDPLWGTEETGLDPTYDYLYADQNGDGARNYGASEGFTEETPGYGEATFVLDDVDGSGTLDPGEKIVLLKTSKVKAFRIDNRTYRRGSDLVEAPWDDEMLHGTGSSGVMVAGQPGYSKLVGMAPDADLVMATDLQGYRQVQMSNFCIAEGARVVLHEYAPWVGYHLDGSSDLEQLIDGSNAEGVVHVNPAGNLATGDKLFKRAVAAGSTSDIPIEVPDGLDPSVMVFTLLWRDPSRDLELTLESPSGTSFTLPLDNPAGFQTAFGEGVDIAGYHEDCARGTAMVMFYVFPPEGPPSSVPSGGWTLSVVDPSDPAADDLTLYGYVMDEVSGWGKGIHFTESVSLDHLVGWPGTADKGLAVSAYTGHPFNGQTSGELAYYSGQGRRIDDEPILWISAPDNPVVPARYSDVDELSYMIYGGTSGASPHVAGASALIVAADPELDGEGVKAKMRDGARQDAQTGAVPNDQYGHGKLDVYRAIHGEAAPGGEPPRVDDQAFEVPVGPAELELAASDPDGGALSFEVDRDYDGEYDETLASSALPVDFAEVAEHVLKVRVTDATGRWDQALLRVSVVEPPPNEDDDGDGAETGDDDGCDCVAGSGRALRAWPVALFGLGVLALRRRRSRRAA